MPINYANEIEQVYIMLAMKFLGDIPFTGPNILLSTAAVFRSVDVAASSLPTWIPDGGLTNGAPHRSIQYHGIHGQIWGRLGVCLMTTRS
jgi:hypothetical protein